MGIAAAMFGKNRSPCPEYAHELIAGHILDVPNSSYATHMEHSFGFGTNAGQRTYRERSEEHCDILVAHHGATVRLFELGGHFRDEFVRAHARGTGQTLLVQNFLLHLPCPLFRVQPRDMLVIVCPPKPL